MSPYSGAIYQSLSLLTIAPGSIMKCWFHSKRPERTHSMASFAISTCVPPCGFTNGSMISFEREHNGITMEFGTLSLNKPKSFNACSIAILSNASCLGTYLSHSIDCTVVTKIVISSKLCLTFKIIRIMRWGNLYTTVPNDISTNSASNITGIDNVCEMHHGMDGLKIYHANVCTLDHLDGSYSSIAKHRFQTCCCNNHFIFFAPPSTLYTNDVNVGKCFTFIMSWNVEKAGSSISKRSTSISDIAVFKCEQIY